MKTYLLVLLILISLVPQTSNALESCITPARCYDQNLEILIGDIFRWGVVDHLENDKPIDYGIDTEEQLMVTIEVVKEFRGMDIDNVYTNWSQYFKTDFTVGEQHIDYNENSLTSDPTHFRLIEPTIDKYSQNATNYYEKQVQVIPSGKTYVQDPAFLYEWMDSGSYTQNLTIYHTIINEIYFANISSTIIENDNLDIFSLESYEIKTNISNGIVLQHKYFFHSYDLNEKLNYTINYEPREDLKIETKLRFNIPMVTFLLLVVIAVAVIIIVRYRRIGQD